MLAVLICVLAVWVVFVLLGALLHAVKWLIYAAILATIVVLVVGGMSRRGRGPGPR
jgi:hypothetical protein